MAKSEIQNFSVFYKNEKIADVCFSKNNPPIPKIVKYTDNKYKQCFLSERQDIEYIYTFLKGRCYEDGRAELKEILKDSGLAYNDPWKCIQESERLERLYYRAMDRSRRATNPQNYNEDGTVKKGRKTWKYSNHYKKSKAKHSELCRINAVNRQLAINEDANHLRSLGDVFITEPKNASKLMKRAKETTVNNKAMLIS